MHIVYINLDRHHERRIRMDALLQGLPFQRLAAVDGTRLPETSSPLSPFEIACLESHRQAAQLLVDSDAAHVCILEDDVHLGNEFAEFICDESWIPSGVDIIKLETMLQSVRLGASLSPHAIATCTVFIPVITALQAISCLGGGLISS